MFPDSGTMDTTTRTSKKYKIGVLYQGPAVQISSQYDALSELQDFEFFFLYMNEQQRNPAWKPSFPKNAGYEFLPPPGKFWPANIKYHLNANIRPVLNHHNFDAMILHGIYDNNAVWQVIWWCKRNNKPYLLRCDANVTKEKGFLRRLIRKVLISNKISDAAALLYIGTQNKKYYQLYGARNEQFFLTPWEIDYEQLQEHFGRISKHREEYRLKFGIKEHECAIICVGRLIKVKDHKTLLKAVDLVVEKGSKVKVIIVGEGPYRKDIEEEITKRKLPVTMCGNLDRDGIVENLVAADIFTLTSCAEAWGLVVNEAALCGLPLVLSSAVGAAADLLVQGENGFLFETGDYIELHQYLLKLSENKSLRGKMGEKSKEIIADWRSRNSARIGYEKALKAVLRLS